MSTEASNVNVVAADEKEFKVWKTIKLGTEKSSKKLARALALNGCVIEPFALSVLDDNRIEVEPKEIEVDLIRLSPRDIGFEDSTSLWNFYEHVLPNGADFCTHEVGAQLRRQYLEQPPGERLYVAELPIVSGEEEDIFCVGHNDDGLYLGTDDGDMGNSVELDDVYVFILHRENEVSSKDETAAADKKEFKVWKTVKGHAGKSIENYKEALEKGGYLIDDPIAEAILKRVMVPQVDTELDLVEVTVGDLGFTEKTRFRAICKRANMIGLELSPGWVGPELRLQYADQPAGERLATAMKPLSLNDGTLAIFCVIHDSDGRRLGTFSGAASSLYDVDRCFIFVRPR